MLFFFAAILLFILLGLGVYSLWSANKVQSALAAEVHHQQTNIADLYLHLSVLQTELEGHKPLSALKAHIHQIELLLGAMRQEYSFSELVGAASASALIEPVMLDLKHWAHRGLSKFDGNSDIVRFVMNDRVAKSRSRLQDILSSTTESASNLLHLQSQRLIRIQRLLYLFFGGFLFVAGIWLWISLHETRKTAEKNRQSQRVLSGVDAVDNGLLVIDQNGVVQTSNRAQAMLLPELSEALELHQGNLLMALSALRERGVVEAALPNADLPSLIELKAHSRHLRMHQREMEGGERSILLADITDLKRTQEMLHREATTDALTGLCNRAEFNNRMNILLHDSKVNERRFALMMIDLDHFKNVNDTLGHAAGDKLLVTVANRISNSLRGGDFAARMGGDEFAVVLDRVDKVVSAGTVAERIIKSLHDPLHIKNVEVAISGSIGVAVWPDHAQALPDLINCADAACYRAKHLGRNNFQLYNSELRQKLTQQLTIEARLRKAILTKSLSMVYQPIWNLDTGEVTGVEALMRWHDEQLGEVTPEVFIPLAEKVGSIAELGEWALNTALKEVSTWKKAGLFKTGILSVNISARQFTLQDLSLLVEQNLAKYQMPASQLSLEITESALMDDVDKAVSTLEKLHSRGVSIIVDDFGVGFSSLMRLRQLPIDTIKIDRSFIRELLNDKDAEALTNTIIVMSRNLRLKVVAEGVESREQALKVQQMGCHTIQGTFFCPPLLSSDIQDFLQRRQSRRQISHETV